MYKDKEKAKEATRERVRRYREGKKGVTEGEGVTSSPTSEGVTGKEGVTLKALQYPGIVDILTDPKQRAGLEKVCRAFKESHHPEYAADVYVGMDTYDTPLGEAINFGVTVLEAGDLLDCTQNVPLPVG